MRDQSLVENPEGLLACDPGATQDRIRSVNQSRNQELKLDDKSSVLSLPRMCMRYMEIPTGLRESNGNFRLHLENERKERAPNVENF